MKILKLQKVSKNMEKNGQKFLKLLGEKELNIWLKIDIEAFWNYKQKNILWKK